MQTYALRLILLPLSQGLLCENNTILMTMDAIKKSLVLFSGETIQISNIIKHDSVKNS